MSVPLDHWIYREIVRASSLSGPRLWKFREMSVLSRDLCKIVIRLLWPFSLFHENESWTDVVFDAVVLFPNLDFYVKSNWQRSNVNSALTGLLQLSEPRSILANFPSNRKSWTNVSRRCLKTDRLLWPPWNRWTFAVFRETVPSSTKRTRRWNFCTFAILRGIVPSSWNLNLRKFPMKLSPVFSWN